MGFFITFEGAEGSGKTTITKMVNDALIAKNIPVVMTREPGGVEMSERIRELILEPNGIKMDDRTESLLFAASRREHLIQKVLPALAQGQVVVCDRFIDSSLAYQGYGREIGFEEVLGINLFAIENHLPDLTFYLDIAPEIGMERIGVRGYKDRLEQEADSFHQRVYEGYQKVVQRYRDRIVVIDASQELQAVFDEVMARIIEALADGYH